MIARLLRVGGLAVLLVAGSAFAHKPSDSYLTLAVEGAIIHGQWDIALRDLDFALGLDADQDGNITWGEVKAKHHEIASYALSRLGLSSATSACEKTLGDQLIDVHSDGAYAVLRFAAACSEAPKVLAVDYRLFFDVDPQHRGLLNLTVGEPTRAGILSTDAPVQQFTLSALSAREQFIDYLGEGVLHIWTGFDHILFLLSLLVPAVLIRVSHPHPAWVGSPDFGHSFRDVLQVVTAFTLAHSITLSLAALRLVSLPSRLVESAIAASVVLAALNNLVPVVFGRRWVVAFGFGLIHGFGFASVLADLGLPHDSLLLALVAFNGGVELGQLAIVAAFLPLVYLVRHTGFYRAGVRTGASLVVAGIATIWFAERAFNLTILPGWGASS